MALADHGNQCIDIRVFGEKFVTGLKAVLQRGGNQSLLVKALFFWPGTRVQIAVHQKFGKAEKAQRHRIRQHLPAGLGCGYGADGGQIGGRVKVVAGFEFGQLQPKVGLELGRQREVLCRIFLQPRQGKALGRAFALQRHGQQNQRRKARLVGRVAVKPLQMTQGQKQDVDALFFNKSAGVGIHIQQAALQFFTAQARLQLQIAVALRHAAFIARFIGLRIRLGQSSWLRRAVAFCRSFFIKLAGHKAHGLVFRQQQAVNLGRQFIGKVQQLGRGSLRQAQQPVARGQVQQALAAFLQLAGNGSELGWLCWLSGFSINARCA